MIARRSERRQLMERVFWSEPLHRFDAAEGLGYFTLLKPLAKSLATQTRQIAESLLCDEAIADWMVAARDVTPQQLFNVGTFCSHCIVQFGLTEAARQTGKPIAAALRTYLGDLACVMYGDFAPKHEPGALTFDDSLQLRSMNDPLEIRDLTRWLDQLLAVENFENNHRELKILKVSGLLTAHVQAFAYRLHSLI